MESRTVKKDEIIARKGSPVDGIWYIAEGKVYAKSGSLSLNLKKGDFIGLVDFDHDLHSFEYTAGEQTVIYNFCSREYLMQTGFFVSKPENSRALALSFNHIIRDTYISFNALCTKSVEMSNFINETYARYKDYCTRLGQTPGVLEEAEESFEGVIMPDRQKYMYQYHKGMSMNLSSKENAAEMTGNMIIPGYMVHASSDLSDLMGSVDYVSFILSDCNRALLNDEKKDLAQLFHELYMKSGQNTTEGNEILDIIHEIFERSTYISPENKNKRIEQMRSQSAAYNEVKSSGEDSSISSQLAGSLDKLLEYSGVDEEKAAVIRKAVCDYKNLADPNSSEDDARTIRKDVEKYFYQLYLAVLEAFLEDTQPPVLARMFLNFGYVDEELAGLSNATELYEIAQNYEGKPEEGVFTGLQWLIAIFIRDREPSINEFDQTYEQFIKEQADNGRIPADQVKLYLADRGQMVMFELQNMFRSASRICSGHISTFCPLFTENQILRSAREDLLDIKNVIGERDAIRRIDYTLFYREQLFIYNRQLNIHDNIHVEVLPDIILLPVIGSRGSMWQEISGRNKMTPARMMLPAFDVESVDKAMIRMFAEYRWEMCKRLQGSRWNDVTDPSLTSLYYDYLQFYRKNSEINLDQKEKIKLGLQRARNVYKEFFINDYNDYIRYESVGSPRLIKASRSILFMQCPFSAAIRNSLAANPMYSDLNDRYKIKAAQQLHKLDNITKKLVSKGEDVPRELEKEVAFYSL